MVVGINAHRRLLHSVLLSVLRRGPSAMPVLRYLESHGLRVDLRSRTTKVHGVQLALTPTEFSILELLMTRAQTVVPHHDIIRSVWDWKYADERNALRLHLNRLRRKLADADAASPIVSSRGVGYMFARAVSQFAEQPDNHSDGTPGGALAWRERLHRLSALITTAPSLRSVARALVDAVVADGLCDSAAVFARRGQGDRLWLQAQSGMPSDWEDAVREGIPLAGQYMASYTVNVGRPLHYVDISSAARIVGASTRLLRSAELSAHLSLPLTHGGTVWGQVGFGRRPDSPFTTEHTMLLEATATLLGALHAPDVATATGASG